MRMTWARRKASPAAAVDRMHFVMWDFLKMFLATVMCGIVVSLVAAGIALVLSNDAYAAANPAPEALTVESAGEQQAHPGVLMISSGCDADAIDATERDWKVTINGKYIDVRVMQTFIVPEGDSTAATFSAALPPGARLLRLNAHTSGSMWQGKVFDAKSYGLLTDVDFRKYARSGMLIVQNDDGAISTDAIINIAATEAVTIEYTYRMATANVEASQSLVVALTNGEALIGATKNLATTGTVWVEWVGTTPSRLTRLPAGAYLETTGTKITGLSWTIDQLKADAPFQLAWAM